MASASAALGIGTPANPALLRQNAGAINDIVSNVANQAGLAAQDEANSQAQTISSQGSQAEASAYGTAQTIAQQNAQLAGFSGQIQKVQALRSAFQTIGAQKAAVAASGFGNSGSALDLLRSSTQQAYLNNQVIGTNSALQQGGFLQQAAAATAEQTAAKTASQAALTLAASEKSAGELAQANAANEASALSKVFPGAAADLATNIAAGKPIDAANEATLLGQQTGVPVAGGPQVFDGHEWVPAGTIDLHTGLPYGGALAASTPALSSNTPPSAPPALPPLPQLPVPT